MNRPKQLINLNGDIMKSFIIALNDAVLYAILAPIVLFGLLMFSQSPLAGVLFLVGGTVVWCIVCGFWFVLSAIHEELRKLNNRV